MILGGNGMSHATARAFPWTMLSWLGAYLVFSVGVIHLLQSDELVKSDATLYALLFVLNFLVCCVSAVFIVRRDTQSRWPWLLGAAVCGGAFLLFFVSRVFGLPGLPGSEERWFSLPGAIALGLEAAFLSASALVLTNQGRTLVELEEETLQQEFEPSRIEAEISRLRDRMSSDVQALIEKTKPGELSTSVERTARQRVVRLITQREKKGLRKAGGAGVALLALAALLRKRR